MTRYLLDRLAGLALRETRLKKVGLMYGPGGYKHFPLAPSAQLDVRGTYADIVTLEETIGYLARQNEVIASSVRPPLLDKKDRARGVGGRKVHLRHPTPPTRHPVPAEDADRVVDKQAFQILQRHGEEMRDPQFLQRLWNRIGDLSPQLQQGFLPLNIGGRPGIRIINTEAPWSNKDIPQFHWAVAALQREFRISLADRPLRVAFHSVMNPWKTHPDGSDYLNDLRARGRTALVDRLVRKDRPQVDRWLLAGFARYGVRTGVRRAGRQHDTHGSGTDRMAGKARAHRAASKPRKLRRSN